MPPRRSLRLVAGALVLTAPLLTSCGFNKATDQPYTPAEGTNEQGSKVGVLAAVIVAAQPNSGTFIATMSNRSSTDEDSLESVESGAEPDVTVAALAEPVELAPRGNANLADEGGPAVTGEFDAGRMIPLTLTFGSGETITLDVPVVFACDEYTGLDTSVEAEASEPPTTGESASPSASESAAAEAPEPSEPYDCGAVLEDEGEATDAPSPSTEGSEAVEPDESASASESPSE